MNRKKVISIITPIIIATGGIYIMLSARKQIIYTKILKVVEPIDAKFGLFDTADFSPQVVKDSVELMKRVNDDEKQLAKDTIYNNVYKKNLEKANNLESPFKELVVSAINTWFIKSNRDKYLEKYTGIERLKRDETMKNYVFIIIETKRSLKKQVYYWKVGSTKSEPGSSMHHYGLAMDVKWYKVTNSGLQFFKYEKPIVGTDFTKFMSELLLDLLTNKCIWGGHWKTFTDRPHFQYKVFDENNRLLEDLPKKVREIINLRRKVIENYISTMRSAGYKCPNNKCLTKEGFNEDYREN